MPFMQSDNAPTTTGLQDVLPLTTLCLPLDSGKEALTVGLEHLASHAAAAGSGQVRDVGAALQVLCVHSVQCSAIMIFRLWCRGFDTES